MLYSVVWITIGVVAVPAALIVLWSAVRSVVPAGYSKERYKHLPDKAAGKHVAELLEEANDLSEIREIRIVAGELNPKCWAEIAPVLSAFVSRKSIQIRLIVYAEVKTMPDESGDHVMCVLAQRAPDFVSIRKVSERPVEHFFIVDDRILRVEDPHNPMQYERSGTIWKNPQFKLQQYKSQFDEAWLALGVSGLPKSVPLTKAEIKKRENERAEFKREEAERKAARQREKDRSLFGFRRSSDSDEVA